MTNLINYRFSTILLLSSICFRIYNFKSKIPCRFGVPDDDPKSCRRMGIYEIPIIFKALGRELCGSENYEHQAQYNCANQGGITTRPPKGQFGNHIQRYAEVFAIASKFDLTGFIPDCMLEPLQEAFKGLTLQNFTFIWECEYNIIDEKTYYERIASKSNYAKNFIKKLIVLGEDVTNFNPFIPDYLHEIRNEFKLQESLIKSAQKTLEIITWKYLRSLKDFKGYNWYLWKKTHLKWVGIHVRRTDYQTITAEFISFDYFVKAMEYFEKKYSNVLFVVVSDDPYYSRKKFAPKSNAIVVSPNPSLHDFAILTQCNHSIIDYGTYGIWSALLAGGETVVPSVNSLPKYPHVLLGPTGLLPRIPRWLEI